MWWAHLLCLVAHATHDKCRKHPDLYRQDLPVIAVSEVCQQHCLAGNKYETYEDIFNLKREDRHFFVNEFMQVFDQGFDGWATRICTPYKNVDELNVYLSWGEKPHLVSLFHMIYQSIRLHQVLTYLSVLLTRKDMSPAAFENLTGLPKGYIENVGDESEFMRDDMGVPELISFRNSKRHDEFINGYVARIKGSLSHD